MRHWTLALTALLTIEGAALACVCIPPEDREVARHIASEAVAVAEIIKVEDAKPEAELPELYRVLRVHVGEAPSTFRLPRQFLRWPDGRLSLSLGTTCDNHVGADKPEIVVLRLPSPEASQGAPRAAKQECATTADRRGDRTAAGEQSFSIGHICDQLFLNRPGALELVKAEARKLGRRVSP